MSLYHQGKKTAVMEIQHLTGETAFTTLAPHWDALARKGMTNTPFQQLSYQASWWHNLHPAGSTLHTLVARQPDGHIAAIGCFYLLDDVLHFNGCVEETDYLDLIATAAEAQESWAAMLDYLLSPAFPHWRMLELCNIPENSPSRTMLPAAGAAHGLTIIESVNEVCPVITLPDSFEAYLESLDSKQRREISRKLRRADGAEAVCHIVGPDEDLDQAVNDFLDLLQKSTFEKRDWLNEGRRAVFHETAAAAQQAGTLQLMFMEVNGEKAATLFNFDYDNRIWVYNSGLDPEAFSALSPGVVMTAWAIENAIENGRAEFDFLRGNETYKYRFGAADTTVYRLQINRRDA
jgi:CelD/BcsL family acetyltransferase involved in cellulose biosynthesis